MLLSIPLAWCAAYAVAPIEDMFRRSRGPGLPVPWVMLSVVRLAVVVLALSMGFGLVEMKFGANGYPRLARCSKAVMPFLSEKVSRLRNACAWLAYPPMSDPARRTWKPPAGVTPVRVFAVERSGDPKSIERMKEFASSTKWVFTDRPMYVFRANLRCPPETVVVTKKRLAGDPANADPKTKLTMEDILNVMKDYKPQQVLLARMLASERSLTSYMRTNYTLDRRGAGESFGVVLYLRNDVK